MHIGFVVCLPLQWNDSLWLFVFPVVCLVVSGPGTVYQHDWKRELTFFSLPAVGGLLLGPWLSLCKHHQTIKSVLFHHSRVLRSPWTMWSFYVVILPPKWLPRDSNLCGSSLSETWDSPVPHWVSICSRSGWVQPHRLRRLYVHPKVPFA